MILGYSAIIKNGRKVTKTISEGNLTTTYGYLTDEHFEYAYNKIYKILTKYERLEQEFQAKFDEYGHLVINFQRQLLQFDKLFRDIPNKNQNLLQKNDVTKIMNLFQPGYIDEIKTILKINEQNLIDFKQFTIDKTHYTSKYLEQLTEKTDQLKTLILSFRKRYKLLDEDVHLLRRCASSTYKFKVFISQKILK